jgi:hypothetical protein
MSEFQYVGFRAIDAPVSEKNLEFMRRQSSRAEVTGWTFDNDYHFGDFHGDSAEMLRRGYDFHFHYANFGVRTLMIRLPAGLPDAKAVEPYLDKDSLYVSKDKSGPGVVLCIKPCYEPDSLDEIWAPNEFFEDLLPLRAEILSGDLRPFYLAHLGVIRDINHSEEEHEGPVPAGLDRLTDAQAALASMFDLSAGLLAAAARGAPPLPEDRGNSYDAWLQSRPVAVKDAWLSQLLADPRSRVRSEILAEYQKSRSAPSWPVLSLNRTLRELDTAGEELQQRIDRQKADAAARERAQKLARMKADPQSTIKKTEELIKQRSGRIYSEIADMLADLREALAGTAQAGLAEQQARRLKEENPKRSGFTGELRRRGFVKK